MVKIHHAGWQKNVVYRTQRNSNLSSLAFLVFVVPEVDATLQFLPSRMADFIPCDQLVQKLQAKYHPGWFLLVLSEK